MTPHLVSFVVQVEMEMADEPGTSEMSTDQAAEEKVEEVWCYLLTQFLFQCPNLYKLWSKSASWSWKICLYTLKVGLYKGHGINQIKLAKLLNFQCHFSSNSENKDLW